MELQPNTIFHGRYRLIQEKGRGSFGEVWLARDEQLEMDVAIKIYIALDDRGIEDFRTEFRTSWSLNHPNLLHAYHFDMDGRRPYLVLPYCPGKSTELVGTAGETEVWKFIRDVASGLSYLHGLDIIHHDIKPDNILRNDAGGYLITDFGISTQMRNTLRRNSTREMNTKSIGGALPYMGPETFSDNPAAVKATDIWALGAALYEIVTGELPFFGQGGGMQLHGAAVPQVNADCSQALKDTIAACLQKETWDRPSAQQLSEYASAYLDGIRPDAPWKSGGSATVPADADPRKTVRHDSPAHDFSGDHDDDGRPEAVTGKRHWIASAWMLFVTLACAGFAALSAYLILTDLWAPVSLMRICAACAVGASLGGWMMWKRIRGGFWIFGAAGAALCLFSLLSLHNLAVAFLVFVMVALTAVVLQIRKNGVSAWKNMDNEWFRPHMRIAYAIALLACFAAVVMPGALSLSARRNLPDYRSRVSECRSLIEKGSQADPQSLIEAKQLLSGIVRDEARYSEVNPSYGESTSLQYDLNAKTVSAAEGWAIAAESQARIGNMDKAIEFYTTALSLNDDISIRSKFEAAAAKVAFMEPLGLEFRGEGEYGETLYASKIKYLYIRLKYNALDMSQSHDAKLTVKVYNNGYLKYNSSVSSSYSYQEDVTVSPENGGLLYLQGWGSDDAGSVYSAGSLRVEVWCGNNKLISESVTLK